MRIYVAGNLAVGKTSFINKLIGENILPSNCLSYTNNKTAVKFSSNFSKRKIEITDHKGTYECETCDDISGMKHASYILSIEIPSDNEVTIQNLALEGQSELFQEKNDILIIVSDLLRIDNKQIATLLNTFIGRKLLVLSKSDLYDAETIGTILQYAREHFGGEAEIVVVSSRKNEFEEGLTKFFKKSNIKLPLNNKTNIKKSNSKWLIMLCFIFILSIAAVLYFCLEETEINKLVQIGTLLTLLFGGGGLYGLYKKLNKK